MKQKKTTISDIAKACGLSITTVSRVINRVPGYCSAEKEQLIWDTIARLHYRPNAVARSLAHNRTHMIAVLIPDIYNRFFQELYQGIEAFCTSRGYKILLCNTNGSAERELAYLEDLSTGIADGILVTTLNGRERSEKLLELHRDRFPLVLIERYGEELRELHRVFCPNRQATEDSIERLYQNGHRRIAYISGPIEAKNAALRLEGYRAAAARLNLDCDDGLIRCGDYDLESGFRAMQDLLKHETFTAFAAANDLMAIGACRAIHAAGLRVPEDISAIGFDGTQLADLHQPPLDTVTLQGCEMGLRAAELLLKQIEEEPIAEKIICLPSILKHGCSVKNISDEEENP